MTDRLRLAQARLRVGLRGLEAGAEAVALVGGPAEATKIFEHKKRIAAIYQKRRHNQGLSREEATLFLENERQLKLARRGKPYLKEN